MSDIPHHFVKTARTVLPPFSLSKLLTIFWCVVPTISYGPSLRSLGKCSSWGQSHMEQVKYVSMVCGLSKIKIIRAPVMLTTSFRLLKPTLSMLQMRASGRGIERNVRHWVHVNQLICELAGDNCVALVSILLFALATDAAKFSRSGFDIAD